VEFLIYEAMGELLEIKKRLREKQSTWIMRDWELWLSCLGTSKKLSGETF